MKTTRPTTITAYIAAAPAEGQAHLLQLYKILKAAAPAAQEAIKWGTPFFVEPRFVFGFSAHKAHLSFAPVLTTMEAFQDELRAFKTTKNFLKVAYSETLPSDLIRKMAVHSMKTVRDRQSDSFW